MKAFLNRPGFLGTYGTFGADVSYLAAIFFTILFMIGWRQARKAHGQTHHTITLWAMLAMLAYFTLYYLSRNLGALALEGKEGFGGPAWIYSYVFTPLLTIHIVVVAVGLVLAVYMIILGFRASVRQGTERRLIADPLRMSGSAFRDTLAGAAAVFGLLAIIRWGSFARLIVYVSGFLLVAVVLLLERGIERWIPDGAIRHRRLGTFTMSLYLTALVTSTATYFMLYVLYPPKHP